MSQTNDPIIYKELHKTVIKAKRVQEKSRTAKGSPTLLCTPLCETRSKYSLMIKVINCSINIYVSVVQNPN